MWGNVRADALTPALSHRERENTTSLTIGPLSLEGEGQGEGEIAAQFPRTRPLQRPQPRRAAHAAGITVHRFANRRFALAAKHPRFH